MLTKACKSPTYSLIGEQTCVRRYERVLRDHPNHQLAAGGATQNTMRAATVREDQRLRFHLSWFIHRFQWLLQQPHVCVYMGCVGQDKYHQLLYDAASKAGLTLSYQVQSGSDERPQTGTCAVLITGNSR